MRQSHIKKANTSQCFQKNFEACCCAVWCSTHQCNGPQRKRKASIRAKWPIMPTLFSSSWCMKQTGVFIYFYPLPWWDASTSQGRLPGLNLPVPIYTPDCREALREWKCLSQENNIMSLARAQTQTTQSGAERTNHEAGVFHRDQQGRPNILHIYI